MPALDYSLVADLYDDYCAAVQDIPFFADLVGETTGPILELMAGTGRVSLPLLRRGAQLTCLDGSLGMLSRLLAKARAERLATRIVAGDVCRPPLGERFSLVILPFQGFSELLGEAEQEAALRSIAGTLVPNGRFVCTLHNPAVRLRTVDGSWHDYPEVQRPGGSLLLSIRAVWEPNRRLVVGTQRIRVIRSADGQTSEDRLLDLRFSLPTLAALDTLAAGCGLRRTTLYGDYLRAAYDERTSPFAIATFART